MGSDRGFGLADPETALRTDDFDYELPDDRIAFRPAPRRDGSRLLVLDRGGDARSDRRFDDLPDLLSAGDALVLNDSRVFPARLSGAKPTGARAEILLVRPVAGDGDAAGSADPVGAFAAPTPRVWDAMVRPGGKLKPGRSVRVAPGFEVEILASHPDGTRRVRLHTDGDPWAAIERHGRVPLPPYIARPDDPADRDRYQTVYARPTGSVAAPTAGLHFTPGLLGRIEARGIRVVRLTLHVGFGTFRPMTAERVDEHEVAPEAFRFPAEAAERLEAVRADGGRVWAVGTTTTRVLETVAAGGRFEAASGWTSLYIRPPWVFRGVDGLITNFHLPRSSLLVLVAAFAGRRRVLEAYRHAVETGYRFYSYGDAMAIS